MTNKFKKYHQAVEYLETIPIMSKADYFTKKSGRSLFLKRFAYFLDLLGNPQNNLNYIHISGSSGKGSVAYMIESILTQAEFNVGLYTSPHCTTTIERIKANNKLVSPAEFSLMVKNLKPKITYASKHSPYGPPSYFEILTAMAFLYFKQKKCDYVVLEVGLGGAFDATNIIKEAVATVINLIDLDHTNILGNKLTTIAAEKAKIIKPKTEVFTTATNEKEVIKRFKAMAKKNKVRLNVVKASQKKYNLSLLGQHQQENAALAAKVCQKLGVNNQSITTGLKKVKMPCRFELIQKNPLIIIDGAHNKSKMMSTVKTLKNLTYKKLYPIIALTKERNAQEIFEPLIVASEKLFVTNFQTQKSRRYNAKRLVANLKTSKAVYCQNSQIALTKALKLATKDDAILITGSLYLAGELRNHFIKEEKILNQRHI